MFKLLGLPPLLILVMLLAMLAFLVYSLASAGKAEPLPILGLLVVAFALVRVLYHLLRRSRGNQ